MFLGTFPTLSVKYFLEKSHGQGHSRVALVFNVSILFNKIQEYCLQAVAARYFSGLICTS